MAKDYDKEKITMPPAGNGGDDLEKAVDETLKRLASASAGKGKAAELEEQLRELRKAYEAQEEQLAAYKRAEEDWDIEKRELEGEIGEYKEKEDTYRKTAADNKRLGKKVGELEESNLDLEDKVGEVQGELDTCGQEVNKYKRLLVKVLKGVNGYLDSQEQ